jgi:hypothetical protein
MQTNNNAQESACVALVKNMKYPAIANAATIVRFSSICIVAVNLAFPARERVRKSPKPGRAAKSPVITPAAPDYLAMSYHTSPAVVRNIMSATRVQTNRPMGKGINIG